MPRVKSSKEEAITAITTQFREFGFDGASLSRLSEASGLGRSSLYHYFPNGKDDMARAAVDHVVSTMTKTIIAPLRGEGDPKTRVVKAAAGISKFYNGGKASCLVDIFAIGDAKHAVPGLAKGMAEALMSAFQHAAEDAGASRKEAKYRAERAVIEIEGALVLSRALGSTQPFQRTLTRLPSLLTTAS